MGRIKDVYVVVGRVEDASGQTNQLQKIFRQLDSPMPRTYPLSLFEHFARHVGMFS